VELFSGREMGLFSYGMRQKRRQEDGFLTLLWGLILFLRSQVAGKPAAFAVSIMEFKIIKIHAGRDKA
jgi:hypothetical protein